MEKKRKGRRDDGRVYKGSKRKMTIRIKARREIAEH